MKILVVGGSGMIGATTAALLTQQGHDVTVAARSPLSPTSPVAGLPALVGDYTVPTFTLGQLSQFEAIVFTAGQDVLDAYASQAPEADPRGGGAPAPTHAGSTPRG